MKMAIPMAGVTINFGNGKAVTASAKDGSFEIKAMPNQKLDMEFSSIMYKTKKLAIKDLNNNLLVTMEPEKIYLRGEVLLVNPVKDIRCVVVNEENEPIPYATIVSDKNIIMAGAAGDFNLPMMPNSIKLMISSVGYNERELLVSRKDIRNDSLHIVLAKKQMDTVIVTGTGSTISNIRMGAISSSVPVRKTGWTQVVDTVKNFFSSAMKTKVYPNPVHSGGSITIQIEKADEGMYNYELMGIGGQVVERRELWIDAEARVLQMEIPVVAPGTYIISLYNKKAGTRISEKIVIQ
jgi:hypothetical protein